MTNDTKSQLAAIIVVLVCVAAAIGLQVAVDKEPVDYEIVVFGGGM